MLRQVVVIGVVAALGTLAACGGGGGGGGGTGPTPVLTSVVVSPGTPTVLVGSTVTLTAASLDQNGQPISAGSPSWSTSDNTKATVDASSGVVTGVAPGNATITASFTAGGVTKTGSQVVSVQQPTSSANVEATTSNTFSPKSVAVARTGGIATVNWTFDALHTVTFDSGPQGADLAALSIGQQSSGSVGRNFTVAGDYAYHCLIHGASMNGTVHVQ